MLLFLAACSVHAPPQVFPVAPEAIDRPAPSDVTFTPAADACPVGQAYVPGEAPPYVSDGAVTCRAQLVLEERVIGWLQAEQDAEYWRRRAEVSHTYRMADRAMAQEMVDVLHGRAASERRENQLLRVVVPAAFLGGLLGGGALALWAVDVAP